MGLGTGSKAAGLAIAKSPLARTVAKGLDKAREAYAKEFGDQRWYHGSTHDISEFDGIGANPSNDFGPGVYMTSSPADSNNYAGIGPDLNARINNDMDVIIDNLDHDPASELADMPQDFQDLVNSMIRRGTFGAIEKNDAARSIAQHRLVGDAQAVTYPLRLNQQDFAVIGGANPGAITRDLDGEASKTVFGLQSRYVDQGWDEVEAYEQALDDLSVQYPDIYDKAYGETAAGKVHLALKEMGVRDEAIDGVLQRLNYDEEYIDLAELDNAIRDSDVWADIDTADGPYDSYGGPVTAALLQKLGYKGIIDNTVDGRFGTTSGRQGAYQMDGVDPDTQHAIVFPGNEHLIRSEYAAFDPEKRASRDITAGVGGAALLGAAAAPEEAEARLPSPEQLQRVIDLGILTADKVGNSSAVKSAITKYNKALRSSKAFADREARAMEGGFQTVFEKADLGDRTIINPEDLQGDVLVPVRGDMSDIGTLKSVGGVSLGDGVPVEGGYKFSQKHADDGYGWASAESIANAAHNKLIRVGEETGRNVRGVYNTMGEESVNFSTPVAEAMQKMVQDSPKLTKADKAAFDAELRQAYPQWVGLDSPDAMNQLMGEGGYPRIGKMRTAYTKIMGKSAYRDRGFPSYKQTVEGANAESLAGSSLGDSGFSIYTPDTSQGAAAFDAHKTYDTQMPGEYLGGLEQSVPFETMFPDPYGRNRSRMTAGANPRQLTHEEAIVASNIRGDAYQVADQKWLDGVMQKATGLAPAAGGAAVLGAGAEDAEAGVVTRGGREMIEAYHGTPHTFKPGVKVRDTQTGEVKMGDRASAEMINKAQPGRYEIVEDHPLGAFQTAKIGTGEGNQVYGHGLYFADQRDVSQSYRNLGDPTYDGKSIYSDLYATAAGDASVNYRKAKLWAKSDAEAKGVPFDDDPEAIRQVALGRMRQQMEREGDIMPRDLKDRRLAAIDFMENQFDTSLIEDGGSMYRVELDTTPNEMLDWDAPFSEQPGRVQLALQEAFQDALPDGTLINMDGSIEPDATGRMLYERLANEFRDRDDMWGKIDGTPNDYRNIQAAASKYLNSKGVSGLRYADGNSRFKNPNASMTKLEKVRRMNGDDAWYVEVDEGKNAFGSSKRTFYANSEQEARDWARGVIDEHTDRTHNYVMFDDRKIKITERGAANLGGMSAAAVAGAATEFSRRRSERKQEFKQLRDRLLGAAGFAASNILEALEMPMQGYHGMAAVGGDLMAGKGLDEALMRGAQVASQPIADTAYDLGGAVTDATGSPAAGTAVNTAISVMGPI